MYIHIFYYVHTCDVNGDDIAYNFLSRRYDECEGLALLDVGVADCV